MNEQKSASTVKVPPPPWSPLSVAAIAFVLPPGGVVLTIRNAYRLQAIDARHARQLSAAAIAVFVLGTSVLSVLYQPAGAKTPSLDSDTWNVLRIGVAIASYIVQVAPFRAWRLAHLGTRTSSWVPAVGIAAMYMLVWFVASELMYFLANGLRTVGSGSAGYA